MTHLRFCAVAISLLAGLSACGGGHQAFIPGATTPASSSHTLVPVQFVMHWPSHAAQVSTRRGVKWISPSTASVIVEVDNAAKTNVVFANAPKAGTTTTTINLDAPVGQDAFTFSLYDAPQTTGETTPTGNELGQAIVPQTITSGKTNTVNATIAGIVSNVTMAPIANQPLVETNASGGYAMVGDSPQIFAVTARDADGNAIVPQPQVNLSAPSYADPDSPGQQITYFNVVAVPNQPGEFSVNAAVANRTDEGGVLHQNLSVTASARDSLGDQAQEPIAMSELSAFYAIYANAPSGAPAVVLYDSKGKPVSLGANAFAGVTQPAAIAYDTDNHRVLVADQASGQILAFDGAGNPAPAFSPVLLSGVFSMLYDSNDHQLFANAQPNGVQAYSGSGSPIALVANAFQDTFPLGPIAYITGDNYIVMANGGGGSVDTYDESGSDQLMTSTYALNAVLAVASDPSSNDEIVAGTPTAAGGQDLFLAYPGSAPSPTYKATVADPRAMAVDPISRELYIASGTPNQISPVFYNVATTFGTPDTTHVIPAAANYSGILGIAITF